MFKRKCKIIFIRHGATIYSEQDRLYDSEDYPPINQKGKEEAKNLCKWLDIRSTHVDKIYSSSALRSVQTARIISKNYDCDYEIMDELHERKSGIWGGLTFEQIEEKYPETLKAYHENPYDYYPEGGETNQELRQRVETVIPKIVKENLYKTVIVVTHSGVIQAAIASALYVPIEHQTKIIIPTGSATQINYFDSWSNVAYTGYKPVWG